MKKIIFSLIIFSVIIITTVIFLNASRSEDNNKSDSFISNYFTQKSLTNLRTDDPVSSPELEKFYFERWHEPYSAVLPHSEMERIWDEINSLPDETEFGRSLNSWTCIGPNGMQPTGTASKHTGRILDINIIRNPSPHIRIGAAGGGLWTSDTTTISDSLTCLAIGSFDSKPGDPNTIFVGTGEYRVRKGTGLWRTNDGGGMWFHVPLDPEPTVFFKLRYDYVHPERIHAATDSGYYRSIDGGATWMREKTGMATDLGFRYNSDTIYIPFWNDGLYKSKQFGNPGTLNKVVAPGFPTADIGRTSVSTIYGSVASYIYVSIARNSNNHALGLFVSTNYGLSFTNRSPNPDYLSAFGNWFNVVSCKPYDISGGFVLLGGVMLFRSINGGVTWDNPLGTSNSDLHVDHHSIEWVGPYNDTVYCGNDGGLSVSADEGATWSTDGNTYPITQYYGLGAGVDNSGVIFGGSQDNGLSGTINGGASWDKTFVGDGSGISIDPNNSSRIFATDGVYSPAPNFRPLISINTGQTWVQIINGLPATNHWATKIRNDYVNPVNIYTNLGNRVYWSVDYGANWSSLGGALPCIEVSNVTVTRNGAGHPTPPTTIVYACLRNNPPNANKLSVYDGGAWLDRSAGLPPSQNLRTIVPHQIKRDFAYALVNGLGTPKVFKTINRGAAWTDITGDLPDVPMGDLVPHPTNDDMLYLGTEFGCYKTLDGGAHWIRWNNGMAKANVITEMTYIDSSANYTVDKYYIIAGSYGRSIWKRKIEESVNVKVISNTLPTNYRLYANYPNPFNPSTSIRFDLPKSSRVKLIIYDILGKEIATPLNEKLNAGSYEERWDGSYYPSGVYFYKLIADEFSDVKKMLLIK